MIFISFGSHPRSAVLKFVTLFADAKFLRGFYSFGNVFRRERLQQTAGCRLQAADTLQRELRCWRHSSE